MDKKISNIIFTKNRPMQLDGYLTGLYKRFPAELIQTYILYKPELFGEEYEQVFKTFPDAKVIRESNFHKDFLSVIEDVRTPYILFGIDDVIYFDKVQFDVIEKTFEKFGNEMLGFSLRLDKKQLQDDFENGNVKEILIDGQTVYIVDWIKGQTKNSRYPFELCATVYRTEDVKKILAGTMNNNLFLRKHFSPDSRFATKLSKLISSRKLFKMFGYFFNPNTLESWCCRWTQQHSDKTGRLLAFAHQCACAVQVNMVNTSTNNTWDDSAEHTVEALNEKYRQGWRVDTDFAEDSRPCHTHHEREFFRLVKRD